MAPQRCSLLYLLFMIKTELYTIVQWPESQDYLQEPDIHLINDDDGYALYGSSAYFVPLNIYEKVTGTTITIEEYE